MSLGMLDLCGCVNEYVLPACEYEMHVWVHVWVGEHT